MNFAEIKDVLAVGNVVISAVLGLLMFAWRYDKSQTKRVDDLETMFIAKVAEHESRLKVIDEKFKHVPTSNEVTRLSTQIEGLQSSISALNATVQRQNQWMVDNK